MAFWHLYANFILLCVFRFLNKTSPQNILGKKIKNLTFNILNRIVDLLMTMFEFIINEEYWFKNIVLTFLKKIFFKTEKININETSVLV